ncbi:TIR domain-containing protein [Flavobacterium sp. 90]|uniref:toll/interleukin-1 receptor domain-containing protein n=1 Tax=unclassified Flavobacterium TaxID=196869 RepID=UPI000EADAB4B|nr:MULTISPECIES: toll/interleukin-1 receptor domain-containing protein [unclassified Flavobacterium]RKR05591.1 TIR domain-containing protein [Flavobacterium sp. 81]TCK56907.1 TIR domain-containing protein [Flavobacterium sp. 90]
MAYQYDVFISYKNHHVTNTWVIKFEEKLKYWLTQELGGNKPKIFFDKDTIETGNIWPNTLKNGVKTSKCLLCIWTPEYFRSKWCLSEWLSFEERTTYLNNSTHQIILPIRFHDGEHYPAQAKLRQCTDVTNYSNTNNAFWETQKAMELEDTIKDLCKTLAVAIQAVPDFNDNFPIIEIDDENPNPPQANRYKL